jgi:hypothetical protein
MRALESLQIDFFEKLYHKDHEFPDGIKSTYPQNRFNIYRQGLFSKLRASLESNYPGVWKLLGEECANQVAYEYVSLRENIPREGSLNNWGDGFSDFLETLESLRDLPYLKDFARYEWLTSVSLGAPHGVPLEADALQQIPEEALGFVMIEFLPSVILYQSTYPLDKILDIANNPDAPEWVLSLKTTSVLILRPQHKVLSFWIESDLYLFLDLLNQANSLSDAVESVLIEYPDFDLTKAIQFMLQNRMMMKITLSNKV